MPKIGFHLVAEDGVHFVVEIAWVIAICGGDDLHHC